MAIPPSPIKKVSAEGALVVYLLGLVGSTKAVFIPMQNFTFQKSKVRKLTVSTPHGKIKTPFFMPIATRGAVKGITAKEIKSIGAQILLGNTYHLWLKPGINTLKSAGGLHKFMNWPYPILTDSGGFQVFSLSKLCKLSDKGAVFKEELSGKEYFLTPQKSIDIQLAINSDIQMVLDECPPWPSKYSEVKKVVERTTKWAQTCYDYLHSKVGKKRPLLFAIVQGGTYLKLREKSAKELTKLNFDGYAIGGVAVGEPRKYLTPVLKKTIPFLPINKPRYLMGLGRPEELLTAIQEGIDMFDCVIPSREGRHGRLFIRGKKYLEIGKKDKVEFTKDELYTNINIIKAEFKNDFKPIDPNCDCPACTNYSRAYIHQLFRTNDILAQRLSAVHNLRFYLELMQRVRS